MEIGDGKFLSSGLSFALNSSGIKFNELKLGEQNDPLTINQENLSTTIPDFNIGISYFSKKVFLGLSSNQVIANSRGISKDNLKDSHSRHFYFDIGANFKYQSFNFIPIINLKYSTFTPLSSLVMLKSKYKDKFWINMAYRLSDSFIFGVGSILKDKVALEYNFDLTTSKLNTYNNGTHELVLKVTLGNKKIEGTPSFY
jgi:type IX secretion system PorP/SprF family membrane protein